MLVLSRRGEDSEHSSYDILSTMASPTTASKADSDPQTASTGVSAFVARVLDQLALSAWLPAAFLVTGIAVLLEFRSTKSASIPTAVEKLTAHSLQLLVLMIPLLVLATVITQAFSFEAFRVLEGYWRRRGIVSLAYRYMSRRHLRRKRTIIERHQRERVTAFINALPRVLYDNEEVNGRVIKAVVSALADRGDDPELQGKDAAVFDRTMGHWRDQVEAWRLARVDHFLNEENSYPEDSRILPTRLGNLMRSTEDNLKQAHGDVQSFVHRQRDTVSYRVQIQHDQFRTRLDMYCTLVFVSVALAALAPAILAGMVDIAAVAVTTGSFVAMAVISYLAAIASARGYCTILKMMDKPTPVPAESESRLLHGLPLLSSATSARRGT